MGELHCVDGSILTVAAVACRDRAGKPYEITLELARDHEPFAAVGERCRHQLAALAARLSAAREDPEQAEAWPDPNDRFPGGQGSREHYLPGEREYFSLRSRDRSDLPGTGEFRCTLRTSADWIGECSGTARPHRHQPPQPPQPQPPQPQLQTQLHLQAQLPLGFRRGSSPHGGWRLTRRAVVDAWGARGIGVRAVLTSAELVTFLDTVLREPDGAVLTGSAPVGATTAGKQPGGLSRPSRRQRGRVPDGTARTRLPAVRAQARGVAVAVGDSPPCRGDVRR